MDNHIIHNDSRANSIDQYKAYFQDIGNIGVRHENSRKFYLSVISALFAFVALAGNEGLFENRSYVLILSGTVGMLLCIVWVMHMQSFRAIYRVKLDILRAIEERYGLFHIFENEWKFLKTNPRYKLLSVIDSVIPILFLLVFAALLYLR